MVTRESSRSAGAVRHLPGVVQTGNLVSLTGMPNARGQGEIQGVRCLGAELDIEAPRRRRGWPRLMPWLSGGNIWDRLTKSGGWSPLEIAPATSGDVREQLRWLTAQQCCCKTFSEKEEPWLPGRWVDGWLRSDANWASASKLVLSTSLRS